MSIDPSSPLPSWQTFYFLAGSASAALTGLQFLVVAFVAQMMGRAGGPELGAFATPTVVHFALALLLSATMVAPWPSLGAASFLVGAVGLGGVIYEGIVARRARRQTGYRPVLEDWLWHVWFPLLAYASVAAGALLFWADGATKALFLVGGATVLLLFVGIHNAWDTVSWVAEQRGREQTASVPNDSPSV